MIKYATRCENGHVAESWFDNSEAFDKLKKAGHLICGQCDSRKIEKAPMAPAVHTAGKSDRAAAAREAIMREIANADDVGKDFAREAIAIHEGRAENRTIKGEATEKQAQDLAERGVPFAALKKPSYDA